MGVAVSNSSQPLVDEAGDISVDADADGVPDVQLNTSELTSPQTETIIHDQNYSALITRVTLYESGQANIYLQEDHGCFNQVTVGHVKSDATYKAVTAPEFSGPLQLDLKDILRANGPYPNRQFEIALGKSDGVCLGRGDTDVVVTVPEDWVETT